MKQNLYRSIDKPSTEMTIRSSQDSFTESIETNIGLIKRRIKSNKLWNKDLFIGRYTKTKISILHIDGISDNKIENYITNKLNNIKIDKLIDSGTLKHLLQKEYKSIFPTIISTERPDKISDALLNGKTVIVVDNSPFALIMPISLNDFFISEDDKDSKSLSL